MREGMECSLLLVHLQSQYCWVLVGWRKLLSIGTCQDPRPGSQSKAARGAHWRGKGEHRKGDEKFLFLVNFPFSGQGVSSFCRTVQGKSIAPFSLRAVALSCLDTWKSSSVRKLAHDHYQSLLSLSNFNTLGNTVNKTCWASTLILRYWWLLSLFCLWISKYFFSTFSVWVF